MLTNQASDSQVQAAWHALLALAEKDHGRRNISDTEINALTTSELSELFQSCTEEVRRFIEFYLPYCLQSGRRFVTAHLGQSLDGRIAAANGSSRWVTGQEDIVHNHRMRALSDVVVVGAGTVRYDDPKLTVREVEGRSPVRVVIDPRRRLAKGFKVFEDGDVETLLFCFKDVARNDCAHGQAEIVAIEGHLGEMAPSAILQELERRGFGRIFIEGGGLTVSRFLNEGCLDRLQIAVAPVIIGSGRPSISLPEIDDIGAGIRPSMRMLPLGQDLLYECCFDVG